MIVGGGEVGGNDGYSTKSFFSSFFCSMRGQKYILWSLGAGVKIIHDFFCKSFDRNELMQARTLTSQQVKRADKFQLEFVIRSCIFCCMAHAPAGA